ncbi:MAG: hypothetical protein M0Q38_16610 [Bacteroidales bacterium]|jgi:hypothetical protein|nr:hypothetical protein [Bacteroidales bacterium]
MKHYIHSYFLLIAVISGSLILPSCLPERKVAQVFIQSPHEINLLVFPPDLIYKYNHKGETIPGFDSLNDTRQDSALWINSSYMQYLSDSMLLETYMNHFIDELRELGFNVYLSNAIDSFMKNKPQSYALDIAQMQLDEYLYPLEDEEPFEDTIYYKRFDLNAIDFSCWFELSKVNITRTRKTILYSSLTAYDTFDGQFYFDPWTSKVKYKYKIDTLRIKDVYEMAGYIGKKHAGYLYDYFLNQYIAKNLPPDEMLQYYYHYDRLRKNISPVEDDRFEIIGSK